MSELPFCQCHCGQRVSRPKNIFFFGHGGRYAAVERRKKNPPPLCACGCGQQKSDHRGKFLRGHGRRGFHNNGTLEERFWTKVHKTESCWLWVGELSNKGYGRITYDHFNVVSRYSAHRLSWVLNIGPIPDELQVLHNCPGGDNPACVNPAHLWLGTQAENIQDCIAKGRHVSTIKKETYIHGSSHVKAKLTESQILQIRALIGTMTLHTIATMFHVGTTAIRQIRDRKTWRHVL